VNKPTALIFDWDNTLVDSWGSIHDALYQTFTKLGHTPWSMDEVRARVRQSLRDSFPLVFGDKWEQAKDIYLSSFEAIHLKSCHPLDGAAELLNWLAHNANLPMAIVSNKTGRLLRKEVDYLGWSAHFNAVIGAGDAVSDKPNPAPVFLVRESLKQEQQKNIWFVGDTDIDMECARNSDCYGVLIEQDTGDMPDADISFVNLTDLNHHLMGCFETTNKSVLVDAKKKNI